MTTTLAPPAAKRLVGTAVIPTDAQYLVLGEGKFVNDVRLPDTVHVAFVRSAHAHARVIGVDVSQARAVPGVVAVLTGDDVEGQIAPFRSQPQQYAAGGEMVQEMLARQRVRFVGEPVCAVAAVDRYTAEDAAEKVMVDYEPLPVVSDARAAMDAASPLLHEEAGSNILIHRSFTNGDVAGAFASAARIVKREVRLHRKTALPLECRGCVAAYRHDQATLTVWMNHQRPYIARYMLARHLGLKEHEIRVIAPDIGGGFGQKSQFYPEEFVVAYLALTLKRPVKWIEDRLENLLASSQARDHLVALEAAVDEDGRILGLKANIVVDVGAYSIQISTGGIEPLQTAGLLPGPYKIRSYAYETYGVMTNKSPVGAYRAVGRPSAALSLEQLLDEVARTLGRDPAAVRRVNLIQKEDLPYQGINRLIHDRTSYTECFEKALELAGYGDLRAAQRVALAQGKLRGIGLCCYAELTGLGTAIPTAPGTKMRPGRDAVTLRLEPSGVLSVMAGMPSTGQRITTAFAQVAADALGLRLEDIKVYLGDTAIVPYSFGTFASRTAVIGGGAIIRAARELKRRLLDCAAYLLGVPAEALEISDSVIATADQSQRMSLAELAETCFFEAHKVPDEINVGFEVTSFYDPHFGSFANGAHLAVVDLDRQTGQVAIAKYVAVEDCGKIINPAVVQGQIEGAIAQGIGEALLEELVYDEAGQLLTGTLMDLLIPTAGDVPHLELHHVETPSAQEGGFKGVGEGALIGALAAVSGAVVDALSLAGATLTEFPANPERVHRALRAAQGT